MAEITYQMVLSTLQTVGLLVGIFYYVMTLNYSRKNQELQLETKTSWALYAGIHPLVRQRVD